MNNIFKHFKGEKYIYYLMAYRLAKSFKEKGNSLALAIVGDDNGYTDGYHYQRNFTISEYHGQTIIAEVKSSKSCADFVRYVEIINPNEPRPMIRPYINESGENCYKWTH